MISNNVCCRIFKEQLDLINQLPEQDRAIVLYEAVNYAFQKIKMNNQDENQDDNHLDNQDESAYISVSVSESVSKSVSVSEISKAVLQLLKKNLICKDFDVKWGGKRVGAGRKVAYAPKRKVAQEPIANPQTGTVRRFVKPTVEEVAGYFRELNRPVEAQEFCDFYESKGWKVGNSPMKDWKASVRNWTRHQTRGGKPSVGKDYNREPEPGKYTDFLERARKENAELYE